MTWRLDGPALQETIVDLILSVDDLALRSALLERIGQGPGAFAVRYVAANIGDILVADTRNEWHCVGTVDFATFERQSDPDWN